MDKNWVEFISTCIIAVTQIYALNGSNYPYLAWLWDRIARICGTLANAFGFWAMYARSNYFVAVNSYGA